MNYVVIHLTGIRQLTAEMFFSTMSFANLEESIKLTSRREDDQNFQRDIDENNTKKIKEFIKKRVETDYKKDLPIFPTPLILGIDIESDNCPEYTDDEVWIKNYFVENGEAKALFYKDKGALYVPRYGFNQDKNSILIIDGQHRFVGAKSFFDESGAYKKEDFNFLVTLMIGNDTYQQSIVFADVNFNQKPVNKSLMYDILGVLPFDKNYDTFAHFLVKAINESEEHQGIVKMLGTGEGIISLAFMVETIKKNMLSKGNSLYGYYIEYETNGGSNYKVLPMVFIDYFTYLKENFKDYYPKKTKKDGEDIFSSYHYKSIMFKTTGIYALLRLLNDILEKFESINYDKNHFYIELDKHFEKIKVQKKELFDVKSEFAGAGSASLQKKLYEKLRSLTELKK